MRERKPGGRMSAPQLIQALERRYPKREYALLTEVANGTGSYANRHADAVALSLWPSRGLTLHGFEVKTYRGDWIREKDRPEKADAIAKFCDYWWLVFSHAEIATIDEIPDTWGLLLPDADGETLRVAKQAVKLEAQPWTRVFMAALLRKAGETMVPSASVAAKVEEARVNGIREGERRVADVTELERLRKVEADADAFKDACGLYYGELPSYNGLCSKTVGEAIKAIVGGGQELTWKIDNLKRFAGEMDKAAKVARDQMKHVEEAAEILRRSAGSAP